MWKPEPLRLSLAYQVAVLFVHLGILAALAVLARQSLGGGDVTPFCLGDMVLACDCAVGLVAAGAATSTVQLPEQS